MFRRRCLSFARFYATEALINSSKPAAYGQPLFQSHPHLVPPGDLTPGIPAQDYENRRKNLMNSLPDNSIVVSVAAPVKFMSNNIFYKYRQASDMWYLTGFEEPESAVILEKTSNSRGYRMTLFCAGKDLAKEQWEGARTGFHEAGSIFRADDALSIDDFSSRLRSLLPRYSNIFVDAPNTPKSRRSSAKSILKYLTPSQAERAEYDALIDSLSSSRRRPLAPEVARLRAVKSDAEQRVMRAAADISGRAHAKTMRFTQPGMSESSINAHFEYICAMMGSQRPAYVPVVASGPNALIIHYTSNNQIAKDGEMVLIDAGCEYNGYASDITRTYPVNGKFTSAQRDLYSAVLSAQKQLVALCSERAGHSLHSLHRHSCDLLKRELKQIGFSFGGFNDDLERVLYPHFLSHPIGIDLHESAYFDRSTKLQHGNVITVEPGVYVPPTPNFPTHFHNMGVRIEDEVVIGETEPLVLTVAAPKEIADVEGACQGLLGFEPF